MVKQKEKDKSHEDKPQQGVLREYFVTIAVCTILALLVTTYTVHPMSVPTPSMEPTILVGDRVLVDKFTLRNNLESPLPLTPVLDVRRQDIIVCKSPLQPEIFLVKRVIGLPGDELEIKNKTVHINAEPLDEPYKQHSSFVHNVGRGNDALPSEMLRDEFGPVTIPPDSYFVMGDNRDDSLDSRYWGFLPRENIIGRPLFIFWSYDDPPDAHLRDSPLEILQLYGERVIFFFTRTRWSRMGQLVR